jgi:hypothetical protein
VTDGFGNPILGGTALIRDNIHSPDFITGVSGWSINKDGTAEFNGVTVRGTIILGNGSTNTIILDNTRDALFVYDQFGKLVASVAPGSGVDSLGNHYFAGLSSYDGNAGGVSSTLVAGFLAINNGDTSGFPQSFRIIVEPAVGGPSNDQPYAVITSPTQNGVPTPITSQIEMFGEDAAENRAPFIRVRQEGIITKMNMLVQGEVKYSKPGAANWDETWHPLVMGASWGNLGAPWGNAAYRMSNGGTVELSGAIQWLAGVTAAPVQITNAVGGALPADYRPVSQKHLVTMTMPAPGATPQIESIEVRTDGTLWLTNYPAGGPNTPISLDGAWFVLGN